MCVPGQESVCTDSLQQNVCNVVYEEKCSSSYSSPCSQSCSIVLEQKCNFQYEPLCHKGRLESFFIGFYLQVSFG